MKIQTHILMAFLALMISACASKEHQTQSQLERDQERQEEFSRNEMEAATRFR